MGVKTMKFPKLVAAMLMAAGAFLYAADLSETTLLGPSSGITPITVTVYSTPLSGSQTVLRPPNRPSESLLIRG
jgi:hypothetical protein